MATQENFNALSSQEKRAALARLLQQKVQAPRVYPLSLAQEGMWFQQQMEPGSPAYNLPLVFCVKGELQLEVLKKCLNTIVERHQVFRAVFTAENGRPVQRFAPAAPVDIPVREMRAPHDGDWKAELARMSHEQSREPFDLTRGPLLRVELVKVRESLHALLMTIHHIAIDGWSIGVFLGEFAALYLALARGLASPLQPLATQYSDFVQWQAKKLKGAAIEDQIAYWRERLKDAPAALELPVDYARPAVQTYRGAVHAFSIPGDLTQRLKEVARQNGATFFMTMLASFYVLLGRLSGQDDIVLGVSVANRERKDFAGIIGLFTNTVPMRGDLTGDPTFLDLLQRVRVHALEDYARTDVPLARLVEELRPPRDASRNVLFQAGFDFQNWPWPESVGDAITIIDGDHGAAKLDINLSLSLCGDGLTASLEYCTDLFTPETVKRMEACFLALLDGITRTPGQRISALPLLSLEDRARVLQLGNDTATAYRTGLCAHQLLEQQAKCTPDACAITHGSRAWTYRELDQYANRLAVSLRSAGVVPESRVGLCGERSPELIAGMFAILKAGACYVPLDPTMPHDRLAYIVEDAAIQVVLTTESLAPMWLESGVKLAYLDNDAAPTTAECANVEVSPSNLAYIIYTSGSTGRPKGVMVAHSSLVNYMFSAGEEFGLRPQDRVLQFASISFDASAEEIFPCLAHGSTLVLRTDEMLSAPAVFLQHCTKWGLTVLDLPTAYWHELTGAMAAEALEFPQTLRLVIIGGEAASPDVVQTWYRCAPAGVRLLNTYGPTEATIVATGCDISERLPSAGRAPIGSPVRNARAYIVNEHGEPVPTGVYGEILLGGAGIARGYVGRPDLTADKFIPDALSGEPGARLYRTGDIGRQTASGQIEFKGRADGQIKLRGFRIELGELESTLEQHADVDHALVLVREGRPGDRRLAAFVVWRGDRTGATASLREWMRQRLPEYMVPASFLILEAFPKTVNGKVDRQALLAMSPEAVDLSRTVTAPRTPSEELMAGIWSEVLGIEHIGVYDNFFELGGHSLLATQILSRVRRAMHVDVPLYAIFEAPTIAKFVQAVEATRWSEHHIVPPPIEAMPRPEAHEHAFPQSFAQQRLWFLEQLEPNTATYNIASAVRLEGTLDLAALERSLNEIVRRHEVLRTTFHERNEQPLQVIAPQLSLTVPVVDLSSKDPAERDQESRRLADEEAHRPFDLSQGPLVRMQVLRLSEQDHLLLFTMHHIVSDAWSMGVLVQELAALYSAYCMGEPSPLRDLDVQYADVARWQREWLSGEQLERQLEYWRKQLESAPAFLQLPTDRQHSPTRSLGGANVSGMLSKEATEAMKQFSRAENVTPFMTLLAAFNALLHRYTGQADIVVGTPIANRHREELEPLIGFFVNTLVMRTNATGDLSFRSLVEQVRDTSLGAYAHQDLPFERLVEQLGPERRWSGTPLFRVMFILQNAPMPAFELPGLRLSPVALENRTTKFDLTLETIEHPDGLHVSLQYSPDLFNRSTIERMLEHFRLLLEGAVQNPDLRLSELPLLTDSERNELLVPQSGRLDPADVPIPVLIEQQVDRTPERIAVADDAGALTYRELDECSNQLARYLIELGVGPESRVGICLRRSTSLLVAVMGVLKAGAAYLPLDPSYPADRLSFMLADGQAAVLLTTADLLNHLPEHSARVVLMDGEWSSQSTARLPQLARPENLAYLIYTSGSTGRPKGVMIEHRNAVTFIRWCHTVFSEEELQVVLGSTSLCFDLSVFEMFVTLSRGGKVLMVPNALELSASEPVTLINTVPSIMAELIRFRQLPAEVRTINLAGEPLPLSLVRSIVEQAPQARILNLYGPSEDTTYSTWYEVPHDLDRAPLIGLPIAETQAYVLDEHLQLVPVGVVGEVYLGGAGLARGYLGRPDLTAERFLPDPFSMTTGARMYKTGDRARRLADGNLECLGRVDHQVKIRGCRIELGEIEAVLSRHAGVSNAAVMVREDRLVAYVETQREEGSIVPELRDAARQCLPEFMVPSAFVVMPSLPQTLNGKVDRKALPAPRAALAETGDRAPRTELEEALCAMWADILQRDHVGIEDNFFELGGHSLRATQVVSRVRKILGVELPLHSLFEEPTVAGLARSIEARRWKTSADLLPGPIAAVARDATGTVVMPQSLAQQRLWFHDQLEPGSATYTIPSAARLRGPLNIPALEASLNELVSRHESLRTTFGIHDEQPVQVIAPALELQVPLIDLGNMAPEEREAQLQLLLDQEGRSAFDLTRGPLLRLTVVRLAPEEHVILFNIHHIVTDGWSMGVLVRELSTLYNARCEGSPAILPPLGMVASDFFARQAEWLQSGALEGQVQYWLDRLDGAPAVLALPMDRPRTPAQTAKGETTFQILAPEFAETLNALGRQQGATLFMVLLAAFKALLSRHTGQTDLVIGTPIANRQWQELECLVGHLTNAVALRTDVGGDPTFRELVNRVRETAIGAYAHQDLPFEKLIEQLGPERRSSRTPLFQVMFVLQNAPMPPLELAGVEPSALTVVNPTTMLDLTMEVVEQPFGLVVALQYSTDLFNRSTIERMLEHFRLLLEGAVQNPELRLSELPLLTDSERSELLVPQSGRLDPADVPIPVLIEQQVDRTPERIAVADDAGALTYRELDERSNQLARYLIELGVGPESRVGICLRRSTSLLVAVLGVLKSGAAYLPLDPSYPADRLSFMLADGQAAVLLTTADLLNHLPEHSARVVLMDDEWSSQSTARLPQLARPENLAYLIYTSGSTGRPKGVMIEHRNAVTFIRWCHTVFSEEELQVVLGSTSLCFDLSVFEMFVTLSRGGKVLMVPNALELSASEPVTLINTVPSIMAELIRFRQLPPEVRTINLAGEPLPLSLVRSIVEQAPQARILNLYGPSEDTTYSTWYEVPHDLDRAPFIGLPIAETQAYVLDEHLQLVPVGVVGEVYLGGAGLARGYLGRPDLTAERFLPDPFSMTTGARMYKTGDRARRLADGNLECLGRVDHQVKIRGCRIELGEIEAVLSRHAGVSNAAVMVREDRLVAYVETRGRRLDNTAELGELVRQHLPDYMIPSSFVVMEALPQTSNGKIDRKALPAPNAATATSSRQIVAPQTPSEIVVADIWSMLLEVSPIGIHDDFFQLGGHSLLATQIVSRVRRSLQLDVPLRRFFEAPTIDGMLGTLAEIAGGRAEVDEIARVYLEVSQLSDEEARMLLEGAA